MLVALNAGTVDFVVTDMPTAMAAVSVYKDMKILDFTGSKIILSFQRKKLTLAYRLKRAMQSCLRHKRSPCHHDC